MMREQANCHGAASTCLSTPQASSYTLPPSNASGCLGRTLYWLSNQVEQTHNERHPSNRNTKYRHHLHIRANLTCFILVTATIFPSNAKRELLFHHRSRTPKFHQLFWNFSESFHQHSFECWWKQLLTEWQGSLFVHLSADAAQILLQHVASSVCQSK